MRFSSTLLLLLTLLGTFNISLLYGQADGTLDTTFRIGTGLEAWGETWGNVIQPDGKIIAGGFFTSYNGVNCNRIVRINTDGSLDTTFQSGSGITGHIMGVMTLELQNNGKILAGGTFSHYNNHPSNYIARINSNGSVDTTFKTGVGFNGDVNAFAIQPDGKILVGGFFTQYDGSPSNYIIRLSEDGKKDTTFQIGSGFDGAVWDMVVQSDGKIVVGGLFFSYNGLSHNGIIRLNVDGTIDTTYQVGNGFNSAVWTVRQSSTGGVIIGGDFTSYDNRNIGRLARIDENGHVDTLFNQNQEGFNGIVNDIIEQPDGKLIVGGTYSAYNSININNIVRLNFDGSLDTSFLIGTGFNNRVLSLSQQTDGKIIAGGFFTSFDGTDMNFIARLNNASTITSINKVFNENFNLSPNPAHHTATLTTVQLLQCVRVIGMDGKAVRVQPGGAGRVEQDLMGVPAGMYVVEAVGVDGRVWRERLVVE